jgi:hypothetical protein
VKQGTVDDHRKSTGGSVSLDFHQMPDGRLLGMRTCEQSAMSCAGGNLGAAECELQSGHAGPAREQMSGHGLSPHAAGQGTFIGR